jgi:hypothetical protein
MTKEQNSTINLIVPISRDQLNVPAGDRRGGQEHGAIEYVRKLFVKPVDAEAFAERLSDSISSTAAIMQRTFAERLGGYEIEQITLSLAVTAEGDIGIATAGVEASVSVSLKRKDNGTQKGKSVPRRSKRSS